MTVTTAREASQDLRAGRDEVPRAAPPGGRSIVRLRGALDVASARELRERLIDVLHRGATSVIIDLSHVPSCDAAGLAVLIGTQRRARLRGSVMLLAAPSLPVAKVLRSTGLDRCFTIYPDLPGAIASQRRGPVRTAPVLALPAGPGRSGFPKLAAG
jgi:anti-anti-sigma factor